MPKRRTAEDNLPETLKPYRFHGLDFKHRTGDTDVSSDCPFCGRSGKFAVNVDTGIWRCFICAAGSEKGGGNAYTFIRSLHSSSLEATSDDDYRELAENRGLLQIDVLTLWQAAKSLLTGEWLLPGYSTDGKLNQLYRYTGGRAMATPGMKHQLYGMNLYSPDKSDVYLTEGFWDGSALWEVLSQTKSDGESLSSTGVISKSLIQEGSVLAAPGVGVFYDYWSELFAGKNLLLLYDNDHPRHHPKTGAEIYPSGLGGMRRVVQILSAAKVPPASIAIVNWEDFAGGKLVDRESRKYYATDLPSGFDIRDSLRYHGDQLPKRVKSLGSILNTLVPAPEQWVEEGKEAVEKENRIECLPCTEWKKLSTAWKRAMRWTEGLDKSLAVMLASIASTKMIGDQLWIKLIGPASCGKSTLCEAVSISPHVIAKSTIRGFHSGWSADGGEDSSLISQVGGKTLVTKDGDTLLQSPNLSQILSEARDVYDTVSRTHYRNKASKDYAGVRMTWILAGTASLRSIDSSELGERFLDCIVMPGIDDEMEDEVLWRVANRAERNVSVESTESLESHQEPEMLRAMQLTGGYVNYLRDNAPSLLASVRMSDWAKRKCTRLGKFVAFMRARPSRQQTESAEREFAARLVSQHVRLAKCLAIVLNRKEVDSQVIHRVTQVALDTGRGKTLEIARLLYETGQGGMETTPISKYVGNSVQDTSKMLKFLRMIGAIEYFHPKRQPGKPVRNPRWRLTNILTRLYGEVIAVEPEPESE